METQHMQTRHAISTRVAITGGTSGLGLALVQRADAARRTGCFDRSHRPSASRPWRAKNGAHGIVGDVANKHDIHRIALQVTGVLGGLDVLVNNASDLGPSAARLARRHQCEDFERALVTNVLGPFRSDEGAAGLAGGICTRRQAARSVEHFQRCGGERLPQWGAYGSSKAALAHMTRIWNEEMSAQGVRFIALWIQATWIRRCTRRRAGCRSARR